MYLFMCLLNISRSSLEKSLPIPCPLFWDYLYFNTLLLKKSSSEKMLIDFRERRMEGNWEGQKHWCKREISISCLLHVSWLGTEPVIRSYSLTGNRARLSFRFRGRYSNQLSHTSEGLIMFFIAKCNSKAFLSVLLYLFLIYYLC